MKPIAIEKLHLHNAPSDRLWQRHDLLLVAAGSGMCLRELYYRAMLQGKLQQLHFCYTTAHDYTMGLAEEKIIRALRQAARVKGVQVVVLYMNCLDVLTSLDYHYIEKSLSAELGVTIRCFLRGPLGKLDVKNFVPVEEFMRQLPPEQGVISGSPIQLPPLATAAAGAIAALPTTDRNVLVAPSGCRACLRDGDLCAEVGECFYTEFSKLDYVFGLEDTCLQELEQLTVAKGRINLFSSAVAAFVGFDGEWMVQEMADKQLSGRSFAFDGFQDAVYGTACATKLLLAEETSTYDVLAKEVLLLGYSSLLCGAKEQYEPYFIELRKLGYKPRFPGEASAGRPAFCWVVSSAGLECAEQLRKQYSVPVLVSCPVGEHAGRMWLKNVRELLAQGVAEQRQLCIHNYSLSETDKRPLLFIGDPIQMMGLAHYFWHQGFQHLQLATICRSLQTAKLYRAAPGADKWLILVDSLTMLQDLWEDATIVFADRQLAAILLSAGASPKQLVDVPWGLISGRRACFAGSGVLGCYVQKQLLDNFND